MGRNPYVTKTARELRVWELLIGLHGLRRIADTDFFNLFICVPMENLCSSGLMLEKQEETERT